MKFSGQLLHSLSRLVKLSKFTILPHTLLGEVQTHTFSIWFINFSVSIVVLRYCAALLVWSVWVYSSPFIYKSVSFELSLFPVLFTAIKMCLYVQKYQHRSANAARHVSIVFHGGWHRISRTLLVHKVRMVIIAVPNSCVGLRKRWRLPSVPFVSMG